MSAADGNFYIAMAFDAEDRPVFRVGQGHGIRVHETVGKAMGQVRRWLNGDRTMGGNRIYHQYPRSKCFHMTYVAGVLMATEIEVPPKKPRR